MRHAVRPGQPRPSDVGISTSDRRLLVWSASRLAPRKESATGKPESGHIAAIGADRLSGRNGIRRIGPTHRPSVSAVPRIGHTHPKRACGRVWWSRRVRILLGRRYTWMGVNANSHERNTSGAQRHTPVATTVAAGWPTPAECLGTEHGRRSGQPWSGERTERMGVSCRRCHHRREARERGVEVRHGRPSGDRREQHPRSAGFGESRRT
jgi:hypothetical protein